MRAGLIPAHAGKTDWRPLWPGLRSAHPRSRGENVMLLETYSQCGGSSPLTRGKPTPCIDRGGADRLIPAHAGKTVAMTATRGCVAAHPRSRGENVCVATHVRFAMGSSPLTRGKHVGVRSADQPPRLIPAHAGKTGHPLTRGRRGRSHPRSRGENTAGDQPLRPRGLIPAHAGKTRRCRSSHASRRAHPRSRGENGL